MRTTELTDCTPRYVLIENTSPVGPTCEEISNGQTCLAVYGFTNRKAYDAFCSKSRVLLRPYPLHGGYLKKHFGESVAQLQLVIIDAIGPNAHCIQAATLEEVYSAQCERTLLRKATYVLYRNEKTEKYAARLAP